MDWTRTPPANTANVGYRLVRTPQHKPLRAILLDDDMIGTYTHYHKGRTLPCGRNQCEACDDGIAYRWHGYVSAILLPSKDKVILELTAMAAEQLHELRSRFGTLRGLEILADRPSRKPNGRVTVAARASGVPTTELPNPPNVTNTLLHIWGMDDATIDHSNGRAKNTPYATIRAAAQQIGIHPSAMPD